MITTSTCQEWCVWVISSPVCCIKYRYYREKLHFNHLGVKGLKEWVVQVKMALPRNVLKDFFFCPWSGVSFLIRINPCNYRLPVRAAMKWVESGIIGKIFKLDLFPIFLRGLQWYNTLKSHAAVPQLSNVCQHARTSLQAVRANLSSKNYPQPYKRVIRGAWKQCNCLDKAQKQNHNGKSVESL